MGGTDSKIYGRITVITALAAVVLAVGSLVWNLSDTSTKANQAYAFMAAIHDLPSRVTFQEKELESITCRLKDLEKLSTNVAVLNSNISSLSNQIHTLQYEIDKRNDRENK